MKSKIKSILKTILQISLVGLVSFVISFGLYVSVTESIRMPTSSEMRSLNNISNDLNSKQKRTALLSRHSILSVLSTRPDVDGFAKMSGTYITHNDKFYVMTAAHGVMGDCEHFFVATSSENIYDCVKYIIVDNYVDYAIIEIEEVPDRKPVKLSEALPTNREWRRETSVLNDVLYTGFPNSLGPLTIRGSIAGMSEDNYIYLHSYAWPGSSGSGVFSHNGNLIGIVIALNVGFTGAGYDVLEDLVIVTPLFMIDWDTAYDIMDQPPPASDTGDTGN